MREVQIEMTEAEAQELLYGRRGVIVFIFRAIIGIVKVGIVFAVLILAIYGLMNFMECGI